MAGSKAKKSKMEIPNPGYEQDHEQRRREEEEAQQQDLNQGSTTGTHDSTRHGVEWGESYRNPIMESADEREEDDERSNKEKSGAKEDSGTGSKTGKRP